MLILYLLSEQQVENLVLFHLMSYLDKLLTKTLEQITNSNVLYPLSFITKD